MLPCHHYHVFVCYLPVVFDRKIQKWTARLLFFVTIERVSQFRTCALLFTSYLRYHLFVAYFLLMLLLLFFSTFALFSKPTLLFLVLLYLSFFLLFVSALTRVCTCNFFIVCNKNIYIYMNCILDRYGTNFLQKMMNICDDYN